MRLRMTLLVALLLTIFNMSVLAQEGDEKAAGDAEQTTEEELTLEELFPDKGLFGPRARSLGISHDGRYGVYLWRTYAERRHGSDLWIYDFESGETKRITMVSVMSEFQEDARKVGEDRVKKNKKTKKKLKDEKAEKAGGEEDDDGEKEEEQGDEDDEDSEGDEDGDEDDDQKVEIDLRDVVDDKDAEAEKDPRYRGVSSYVLSPKADTLIFTSSGDLYLFEIEDGTISRLTRTDENERAVQYLPDGMGYTYLRDGALMCVRFGSHLLEQLQPKLAEGETMRDYEISPDGTRIVLLTGKGRSGFSGGEKVTIINYRDRFAKTREITRSMPSSKLPDFEWGVYLYDMTKHMTEKGALKKVFTHKQSGPRDIFRVPQWAPDSSKVAFIVFDQETSIMEILEAGFVEKEQEEEKAEAEDDADGDEAQGDDAEVEADEEDEGDTEEEADDDADEDPFEIHEAKLIYKFLHHGGPNTPTLIRPYYLPDSKRIAFLTEQSGFRHVSVLDPLYETLDQITHGRFEVYPFDLSEDHSTLFVRSNKGHPSVSNMYALDLESGEMKRLSEGDGVYSSAAVSDDSQHMLTSYVDFGELRELRAVDAAAEDPEKIITDSHPKKAHKLTGPIPEYFTFKNRHGHDIHGHMFKPDDWTENDTRPLLIYVYGGPLGSNRNQLARGSYSTSSYFFAYYMAKKHGYVTCTIDPRGVSGYGALFEKSNFEQVGKPQVEDIVDAGKWMIENHGVDAKRIGMHGWSFGGFQTQMCLYTEPDFFACGIAGAGPTEWFNYNSWYTTGTIGERKNVADEKAGESDKYSLLPIAKNLKAKLLLLHGMEDTNVLYQDTVRVYRELLKAGKETLVELFLDPTGTHGLGGDVKTLGRFRKYEEFLIRVLGEGEAAVAEVEEEETE